MEKTDSSPALEPYVDWLWRAKHYPIDGKAMHKFFVDTIEEYAFSDSPLAAVALDLVDGDWPPPKTFTPTSGKDIMTAFYRPSEHEGMRWSRLRGLWGVALKRYRNEHVPRERWI